MTRPDGVPSIKDRLLDVFPAITPSKYDAISRFISKSQKKSVSEDKDENADVDERVKALAEKVAENFGTEIKPTTNGRDYKTSYFKYKGKSFFVRIMIESKRRLKPYFRVALKGNGSIDINGIYSSNRAKTHIDIDGDSYRLILEIIEKFIKSGGKSIG